MLLIRTWYRQPLPLGRRLIDSLDRSMKKSPQAENTPFIAQEVVPFQFSLASLLIAMAIFSLMSACLLWASRLPSVTDELHAWMGTIPSTNRDGTDRSTQLMFLLFCYSTPLMLAATIHFIFVVSRYFASLSQHRDLDRDHPWKMEA